MAKAAAPHVAAARKMRAKSPGQGCSDAGRPRQRVRPGRSRAALSALVIAVEGEALHVHAEAHQNHAFSATLRASIPTDTFTGVTKSPMA